MSPTTTDLGTSDLDGQYYALVELKMYRYIAAVAYLPNSPRYTCIHIFVIIRQ